MNVVTIPSNVADEIEGYRKVGVGNAYILADVLDEDNSDTYVETLRSIPFDTLLSALVNGYVREKTEAERHAEVLAFYRSIDEMYSISPDVRTGIKAGIHDTLKMLGINIEGVRSVFDTNKPEVSANV